MDAVINGLLDNKTLISAVLSWVLAQIIKCMLAFLREGDFDLNRLVSSGGMPSGHAALVSAVAWGIGMERGFASSEFALASVIAVIVMYDAAGVRQAVGTQAKIINEILHDLSWGRRVPPLRIREILGHTPKEVIAGALLGFTISFLMYR